MVVEKLEMVETRNRNLEGLLAESEKREELRNDREAEMQARISLLESRLERCERAAQMHGAGLVDGEPEVVSCEPLSAMKGKQPSWTPEVSSSLNEDSLPEEPAHVDAGGFLYIQKLICITVMFCLCIVDASRVLTVLKQATYIAVVCCYPPLCCLSILGC